MAVAVVLIVILHHDDDRTSSINVLLSISCNGIWRSKRRRTICLPKNLLNLNLSFLYVKKDILEGIRVVRVILKRQRLINSALSLDDFAK